MTNGELVTAARAAAARHGLDAALVCAVCEQESAWNTWAVNPEPAYPYLWDLGANAPFHKIAPSAHAAERPPEDFPALAGVDRDAEWWGQQMSWGLMQVMGAVARERGFRGKFLSELCDPLIGLEFGCLHLAALVRAKGGNLRAALLRWNGGGNPSYDDAVLARMGKYHG